MSLTTGRPAATEIPAIAGSLSWLRASGGWPVLPLGILIPFVFVARVR